MNKTYVIAAAAVATAIVSVFLFIGQTNSFQNKIDELCNMDVYNFRGQRVGVFECMTPWANYPAEAQADCYRYFSTNVQYDVREAASWTAFKSLLKQEQDIDSPIFYDPKARVIWFDAIRWDDPRVMGTGILITWFIPA